MADMINRVAIGFILAAVFGLAPVSYTHLDVYKRQVYTVFQSAFCLPNQLLSGSIDKFCWKINEEFLDSLLA